MAKLYTLIDDFNDNSRNTSLWNQFGSGVAEVNGQVEISISAGSTDYHGYTSATTYDATASEARSKVVSAGNQALASLEVYPVYLQQNINNSVFFIITGGNLAAYQKVAGANTSLASTAYNADNHRFLRIKEASGTTYWQYSADGITWSTLHSKANPITMTAITAIIEAGTWSGEASGTTVKIDEFNTFYLRTDYKSPFNAYSEDGVGTAAWTSIVPNTISGGVSAHAYNTVSGNNYMRELRIMLNGVISSNAIDGNDLLVDGVDTAWGGASNLWGETALLDSQIEKVHFGIALALGDSAAATDTNYLVLEKYYLDVPDDATISGIQANTNITIQNIGGGVNTVDINKAQIRVYFQWKPTIAGTGTSGGILWTERINWKKKNKAFRHRVYEKGGNFIGEWLDASDPVFKQQVDTLVSTMEVELKRTDIVGNSGTEDMLTESDETMLTESDETMLVDTQTASGIGAGTDLDTNYDYEVTAIYGEFIELLTESGEPILTESDELIMAEDGAPAGKPLFTGWITDTEADWGGSDTLKASLVSHSHELNNIPFETADTKAVEFAAETGETGLAGAGPSDNLKIGQSFTMVGSVDTSRISIQAKRWGGESIDSYPKLTLTIRSGTPDSPGAVITTAEAYVYSREWAELSFVFQDYIALTNAATYCFELECDQQKSGGGLYYPVAVRTGSSYSGGSGYAYTNDAGAWAATSSDLIFTVWQAGGNTTVTLNSQDPSSMFRQIADFARSRGAKVKYDESTISDTGTIVSYSFKGMTCAEAFEQVLKLCPGDWYYWYDIGTNEIHLHARPTTPSKILTLKKDVATLKVKKSIKNIVNDALFTGGGDPALYIRTQDTASQSTYRRGLKKITDSRVTSATTAGIINDSEIERWSIPVYNGSGNVVTVASYLAEEIGGNVYIEDYTLGELMALAGFNNSEYNGLELQLVGYTYSAELLTIEVGTLLPRISKRIEDIKRNLNNVEQQYQPSAPS